MTIESRRARCWRTARKEDHDEDCQLERDARCDESPLAQAQCFIPLGEGGGERSLVAAVGIEERFALEPRRSNRLGRRVRGSVGPSLVPSFLGQARAEHRGSESGTHVYGEDVVSAGKSSPASGVRGKERGIVPEEIPAQSVFLVDHGGQGVALGREREPASIELGRKPEIAYPVRQRGEEEAHGHEGAKDGEHPAELLGQRTVLGDGHHR
jgi:hypothetical protein